MTQTILNRGSVGGDLLVYFHIDPSLLQSMVASFADDALVVELVGNGTGAYRGLVTNAGGWLGYTSALTNKLGHGIQRTAVMSWSAGSQAAAETLMGGATPDALVMLDGLYAPKPAGSKAGDGRVQWTPELEAVAWYATRAARGEKTCIILHSQIPTPYASSKECAEAVQAAVEKALGMKMQPAFDVTPTQLDGHAPTQALVLGNLRILEFPGANGAEHIRQAHLWDEVCKLWIPWLFAPTSTSPEKTLSETILGAARTDLVANVREDLGRNDGVMIRRYASRFGTPPGSNWCALAVADWIHRGALLFGVDVPIPGSPGAKAIMEQIMASPTCLWFDADALRANPALLQPGMVPVWDRSDKSRPDTAWWGHIGVVSWVAPDGLSFRCIEGNSGAAGDRVAEMARSLNEPRLLGAGWLG